MAEQAAQLEAGAMFGDDSMQLANMSGQAFAKASAAQVQNQSTLGDVQAVVVYAPGAAPGTSGGPGTGRLGQLCYRVFI